MLKVKGENEVVKGLLNLLGGAATLGTLKLGEEIEVETRSSATLHRCLLTIINDQERDALVNVDASAAVHFGIFGEWQMLNVINAIHVETGAPGLGVAIAFHEIWENYVSRGKTNKRGPYGPAHELALAVERDIAEELTGEPGGRVAAVAIGQQDAQGWVLDYESYFLVLAARKKLDWPTGRFDGAVKQREYVHEETIGGLIAGERVAANRLGDVLQALRVNPGATAKVTGQHTEAENADLAAQRATAMRSAILNGLDDDEEYEGAQGIELARVANSPSGVLGALRAWIGPAEKVDDEPGATVVIEMPASD